MFLLTDRVAEGRRAIHHMRESLASLAPGPVVEEDLGSAWLLWFAIAVDDELHRYQDGIILGSPDASRWQKASVFDHGTDLTQAVHPLCSCAVICLEPDSVRTSATGMASVFLCGRTVSDSQLLIADALHLSPSPQWVSVLAAVGYLPGTATLFEEVRKLDYGASYSLALQHEQRPQELLRRRRPDDAAMIARMTSLVPRDIRVAATLTGGSDSRFLVGILCRAGARPRLVHVESEERSKVEAIARILDLPLDVADHDAGLAARLYTLLTDAQVVFRAGGLHKLRALSAKNEALFVALSFETITRNYHSTAWKAPTSRRGMLARLVRWGLLNATPSRIDGLAVSATRDELAQAIYENLLGLRSLTDTWSRKASANLFYFYNRALRWSNAMIADLRPFWRVLTLLSDREIVELGISSPAWKNFRKDRIRLLNHMLLPSIEVPYEGGLPVVPNRGVAAAYGRVRYEFGTRFGRRIKAVISARPQPSVFDAASCELGSTAAFEEYFSQPVEELIRDRGVGRGVRRAAVTVSHVLEYLGGDSSVSKKAP